MNKYGFEHDFFNITFDSKIRTIMPSLSETALRVLNISEKYRSANLPRAKSDTGRQRQGVTYEPSSNKNQALETKKLQSEV